MKILVPGHRYELEGFENPAKTQTIDFIKKSPLPPNGNESVTVFDGTTNEDLLKVLINRTEFLNSEFPCRENSIAITKMQEALMWFEWRTCDRKARGVEGKHEK